MEFPYFTGNVRGMVDLDKSRFTCTVKLPAIRVSTQLDLKPIHKLVRNLKLGIERPKFNAFIKSENIFVISPVFDKWEESERAKVTKIYEGTGYIKHRRRFLDGSKLQYKI